MCAPLRRTLHKHLITYSSLLRTLQREREREREREGGESIFLALLRAAVAFDREKTPMKPRSVSDAATDETV